MITFCDASFGDERPMGGHVITLHGSPITWASKRLTCTPLSSCESEWMSATSATVALRFMRDILSYLGFPPTGPTSLLCDNHAACQLSQNEIGSKGMKHITRRVAWLKEVVESGEMNMTFVSGEVQLADIFTKPLSAKRYHQLRRCLIEP